MLIAKLATGPNMMAPDNDPSTISVNPTFWLNKAEKAAVVTIAADKAKNMLIAPWGYNTELIFWVYDTLAIAFGFYLGPIMAAVMQKDIHMKNTPIIASTLGYDLFLCCVFLNLSKAGVSIDTNKPIMEANRYTILME